MIISTAPEAQGLNGLGLSLKPPKWLRNTVNAVVNSGAVKVTVPTASGPVEVNRDSVQAAADALRNARVQINAGGGPKPTGTVDQVQDFVQANVPGGWLTVLGGGLALVLLFQAMGSRRESAKAGA